MQRQNELKLTTPLFIERLAKYKNEHEEEFLADQIKLRDVFEDFLQEEELTLENICFSAIAPYIRGLNFENCILINCDFSFNAVTFCDFVNARFKNPNFQGALFYQCENLPRRITPAESLDNFEEGQERIFEWLKYHTQKTGLLFEYDLLSNWQRLGLVSHPGNFYHYPDYYHHLYAANETEPLFGWKLHLSVNLAQVKEALRLVGPKLAFFYPFKVIDYDYFLQIEHPLEQRFKVGEQITIYLEFNHQLKSPEEVRHMIEVITKTLRANNIFPGEIPESDAITISEYFSLRNDFLHFDGYYPSMFDFIEIPKGLEDPYIYAAFGMYFNYSNRSNPYESLLPFIPAVSIPAYHCAFLHKLNDLELITENEKAVYIVGALTAFLEKYSHIPALTSREYDKCVLVSLTHDAVDRSLIKEEYQQEEGIAQDVKHALLMMDFFVNGCEGDLNKMNCSFSKFIHPVGSLKELLAAIDATLAIHPTQKQANFAEYLLERESQLNGKIFSDYPSFFETGHGLFSTVPEPAPDSDGEKEAGKTKDKEKEKEPEKKDKHQP